MFNTIITNAVKSGANLNQQDMHRLNTMFCESVRLFDKCKQQLGRKNYPSYQYALLQLAKSINIDLSAHIKLPKMKSTLQRVIEDWPAINPVGR